MVAKSSRTILRAAIRCPAASASSASVLPDRSSAAVRVSDTVKRAMLTGRNGRVSSSRPGIAASFRVRRFDAANKPTPQPRCRYLYVGDQPLDTSRHRFSEWAGDVFVERAGVGDRFGGERD